MTRLPLCFWMTCFLSAETKHVFWKAFCSKGCSLIGCFTRWSVQSLCQCCQASDRTGCLVPHTSLRGWWRSNMSKCCEMWYNQLWMINYDILRLWPHHNVPMYHNWLYHLYHIYLSIYTMNIETYWFKWWNLRTKSFHRLILQNPGRRPGSAAPGNSVLVYPLVI